MIEAIIIGSALLMLAVYVCLVAIEVFRKDDKKPKDTKTWLFAKASLLKIESKMRKKQAEELEFILKEILESEKKQGGTND